MGLLNKVCLRELRVIKFVEAVFSRFFQYFSNLGISVSLSADGNTLAVGGYADSSFIGATWIFTQSGGIWTQQGSNLVGTGYSGASQQGVSFVNSPLSLSP
jgi:hypothetical protein